MASSFLATTLIRSNERWSESWADGRVLAVRVRGKCEALEVLAGKVSRLAENDFAVADGESDFGEGADVLGGIGGEDDEVGVEAFGDVAGTGGGTEARGGIGGERG